MNQVLARPRKAVDATPRPRPSPTLVTPERAFPLGHETRTCDVDHRTKFVDLLALRGREAKQCFRWTLESIPTPKVLSEKTRVTFFELDKDMTPGSLGAHVASFGLDIVDPTTLLRVIGADLPYTLVTEWDGWRTHSDVPEPCSLSIVTIGDVERTYLAPWYGKYHKGTWVAGLER